MRNVLYFAMTEFEKVFTVNNHFSLVNMFRACWKPWHSWHLVAHVWRNLLHLCHFFLIWEPLNKKNHKRINKTWEWKTSNLLSKHMIVWTIINYNFRFCNMLDHLEKCLVYFWLCSHLLLWGIALSVWYSSPNIEEAPSQDVIWWAFEVAVSSNTICE